jgi:DNA modification methylase
MTVTLLPGDCLDVLRTLPTASVHCVVTSPPYFGLRAYNGGEQEIGSEATPDAYVARLVAVFREVWRVLRDDGTCWLNLGDSYAGSGNGSNDYRPEGASISRHSGKYVGQKPRSSLASKQLLGIPWRVAFALQADGWLLRSDIVWSKPNCMPESVKDRPTKAHEYVFLLAKQARYFYDADAVKEESIDPASHKPWKTRNKMRMNELDPVHAQTRGFHNIPDGKIYSRRNRRSVWHIATTPFSARSVGIDDVDHFAVMPPKLVEPCVLAGTSERGVCPTCGAPWVRVVETHNGRHLKEYRARADTPKSAASNGYGGRGSASSGLTKPGWRQFSPPTSHTTGWQSSCACGGEPIPATVLDPFCGAGTVGLVSVQHGRRFIGIDLNARYLEIARRRIEKGAPVLPLLMTGVACLKFFLSNSTVRSADLSISSVASTGSPQVGHTRRIRRWARMPTTDELTRKGSVPMSMRRVMAPGASFVCRVESTK